MPDSTSFPIFKVTRRPVDKQILTDFISSYVGRADRVYETVRTVNDIQEELAAVVRGEVVYNNGELSYIPFEGQNERIEALQEELKNTPDVVYIAQDNVDLSARPFQYSYIKADSTVWKIIATETLLEATSFNTGILQQESWVMKGDAYPGEPAGTTIDVSLDQKTAEQYAIQAAHDIGASNLAVASMEKARIIRRYTYEVLSVGWMVTLCRNDGGSLPIDVSRMGFGGALQYEPSEFMAPWPPETLSVYIDGKGVGWLNWKNPVTAISVENENVQLMPFDQIKEKVKNIIKFGTKWSDNVEQTTINITVQSLTLTNTIMKVDDSSDYAVLAPTWLIKYADQNAAGAITIIAINAIDGSRVDPIISMMAVPPS
jgi:hypothetical protein